MLKEEYIRRFDIAVAQCRTLTEMMLGRTLPKAIRFDVHPVSRFRDGNVKLLGGRLKKPENLMSMEYVEARKCFWVDGRVPLWIDVQVTRIEPESTIIEIRSSHKLNESESKLYHKQEGIPPFHVLGPELPGGGAPICLTGWKI